MDKFLHIVSFNIPYPPNYGGIIDVYYKIKALHAQGVKVILHCFEYERPRAKELENICEKVHYYKRRIGLLHNFTHLPYNVFSRRSYRLLKHLSQDDYPILFEGLHTCYLLSHPQLASRFKIVRPANVEHDYYNSLAKSSKGFVKKFFYKVEASKFERFQQIIKYADLVLAVSQTDTAYFQQKHPGLHIDFMPCFHENEKVVASPGQSGFILYHGNLAVEENEKAALFLIEKVFSKLHRSCIIAGKSPSMKLIKTAAKYNHIQIEPNISPERMQWLTREAQIHLLVTFQGTGLKLKLLNSLYAGRYIIANQLMLTGTGLDSLCHIADTAEEMISLCHQLIEKPFSEHEIKKRESLLFPTYSNESQAKRLCKYIYGDE